MSVFAALTDPRAGVVAACVVALVPLVVVGAVLLTHAARRAVARVRRGAVGGTR